MTTSPTTIVHEFLAAIAAGAWDVATEMVDPGFVFDNLPVGPSRGPDAVRLIQQGMGDATEVEFDVKREYTDGSHVIQERIDRYRHPDGVTECPVASVFEVKDGRVAVWRNYFDLATFTRRLAR